MTDPVAVTVPVRSAKYDIPPTEVTGAAPYADSPLAVIREVYYDGPEGKWRETGNWAVTHRPTGWRVGKVVWRTYAEAWEILHAADPTFAAWQIVKEREPVTPALLACRVMWRAATAKNEGIPAHVVD